MKNAPKLDDDNTETTQKSAKPSPAAPVVSQVTTRAPIQRTRPGDTYQRAVCGRLITFTLRAIPAAEVATKTRVWGTNERSQSHLTETSLDDILPSLRAHGQDVPAYGRQAPDGIIEAADGSRRRMGAILAPCDYLIWVADLSDAEMEHFTVIGNKHKATSAFERGIRYRRLLDEKIFSSQRELAAAENIDHKAIARCLATASLPPEIIALFPRLNDLSARAGESLSKNRNDSMIAAAKSMKGTSDDAEQIIAKLIAASTATKPPPAKLWNNDHWKIERKNGKGTTIEIGEEIPEKVREKIESFIKKTLDLE